jgi:hypothetical protein
MCPLLLCSAAAKDVVWSFVVEEQGKITDFISYYLLAVSLHFPLIYLRKKS